MATRTSACSRASSFANSICSSTSSEDAAESEAEVSILRQLGRYDLFRDADTAEAMSKDVPLFSDDYGIIRAAEVFEKQVAQRNARRGDFDWPLKIDRQG